MYFIKEGYAERPNNDFDDQRGKADECQDDVYAAARALYDREGLAKVLDVGCGGGHSLLKHFSDADTIGLDLGPTVEWLRKEKPGRVWLDKLDYAGGRATVDLVIAADVIEHMPDPDELLDLVESVGPKFAVISTPNRDNLQGAFHDGPPKNLCHVREWSSAEFYKYMAFRFKVAEFFFHPATVRDKSVMWAVLKCL